MKVRTVRPTFLTTTTLLMVMLATVLWLGWQNTTSVLAAGQDGVVYTVEEGDTLGRIAAHFGVTGEEIIAANPAYPGYLYKSQKLTIPIQVAMPAQPASVDSVSSMQTPATSAATVVYKVEKGDSLSKIAHGHGIAVDALIAANPNLSRHYLYVGQELTIPSSMHTSTSSSMDTADAEAADTEQVDVEAPDSETAEVETTETVTETEAGAETPPEADSEGEEPEASATMEESAPTDSYAATTAAAWFNLSLKLVRETAGFSPPVVSRAFGYLGVALYETVQPGMPNHQTLAGQLNELETIPEPDASAHYHWALAANSALATLTRQLFPTATPENLAAVDALEQQIIAEFTTNADAPVDATTLDRSIAWGKTVADAVYTWSLSDGGHEGYTRNFAEDYVPSTGPGMWVSTPPQFASALQPYWGENRPFVMASPDACPAPAPPAYAEEAGATFYAEAMEVYETVNQLNDDQWQIALFWADDPGKTSTPPGHWISITGQVLAEQGSTLDVAAEAYAKVGMAVADAFITCWRTKYIHNLIRPISYIQLVIDADWNTPEVTDPVFTPPFPEYTSGHSVQSGAAALVLTSLFGDDYAFTDHTHDSIGFPARSYPSFVAAAQEAAISRLYGGIHYRAAIEEGLRQGECVGGKVLDLQFLR